MEPLGYWLIAVGTIRLASVWFGFFNIWALRVGVFSITTRNSVSDSTNEWISSHASMAYALNLPLIQTVTEVHGRTFGTWTLLTCTLCYICAFNLDNKPLYLATLLSFFYALGHFLTEYLIYQTMKFANLTSILIVAGTSIVWMLLKWNAHQKGHSKHS